jgi:glycosyltransferase involved in cell wall biosynthesis
LDQLVKGLVYLREKEKNIKLVLAGRVKQECQAYWNGIQELIGRYELAESIIPRIEYIPEEEAEIYFKAADVLILPYRNIFQSGLIYSSYRFGLPIIASDVGSMREDIIEGRTGFMCKPNNPEDLARKISLYFESDIFRNLEAKRMEIIRYASEKYSWKRAGRETCVLYHKFDGCEIR